ncbi:ABC transporter permease [Chitinimonas naiadis]
MWTVLRKELTELVRDRRTMIFMLLMPALIMPLLMGGFATLASYKARQEATRVLKYAVFGSEQAPELNQRLSALPRLERVTLGSPDDIRQAIKDERIRFALVIPNGFEQQLHAGKAMRLELHYNDAVTVDTVAKRMKALSTGYGDELRQAYMTRQGLDADTQRFVSQPILLDVRSTANERERIGELIGAFLPYLLLMIGLSASMAAAIDMGAGEKERGTLESLLLLPLPRSRLVLAKFAAIALVGIIAGTVAVISMGFWGMGLLKGNAAAGAAMSQVLAGIGWREFALVGLLILPANAITAALLLAISLYARSYKEAGGYASQLMILLIMPILLALLPNMSLSSGWAWMPITNIALAVKEIVKGTLLPSDLAVVLSSTVLVAGGLLFACTRWCRREEVLFRA